MPADDLNALRNKLQRWCWLVQQLTDERAIEVVRAEVTKLEARISRLEAKKSGNQSQPDE